MYIFYYLRGNQSIIVVLIGGAMDTCKQCGSELLQLGKKWICSNEDCSFQMIITENSWFKELAKDSIGWNKINYNNIPSVISNQYKRLHKLLRSGEIYGAQIKIKDIYEVELKFLILIILSEAFCNDNKKQLYSSIIYELLEGTPSLGTWLSLGKQILKLNRDDENPIYIILKSLIDLDNTDKIVFWRNSNIGHGALMPIETEELHISLSEKIKGILSNFVKNQNLYSKIRLQVKIKDKFIDLNGLKPDIGNNRSSVELFVTTRQNRFKLIPLIQFYENSIYFFDSYMNKKYLVSYLEYTSNIKRKTHDKMLSNMFSSVKNLLNLELVNIKADEGLFIEERIKKVDEILEPTTFFKYDFLRRKIQNWMNSFTNGLFLLEMNSGMGKTTFVKMVDQLSYGNYKIDDKCLCRAFYINSVYGYSQEYFIKNLLDSLLRTNTGEHITGDLKSININSSTAKTDLACNINVIFSYYKKYFNIEKLLIFIDGLDELPNTGDTSIIDLIPDSSLLNAGIYFIFTSRNRENISLFTQADILPKLNITDSIVVTPSTDTFKDYKESLSQSLVSKLSLNTSISNHLLEAADCNALRLQYLINLYRDIGDTLFESLSKKDSFIDFYWSSVQKLFGSMYSEDLIKLSLVLSSIPIPININDLAFLLGEDSITFKLQTFIGILKHFISSSRCGKDTLLIISQPEFLLWKNSQTNIYTKLEKIWQDELDIYVGDTDERVLDFISFRQFTLGFFMLLNGYKEIPLGKCQQYMLIYFSNLKSFMGSYSNEILILHKKILEIIHRYIIDKNGLTLSTELIIHMYSSATFVLKESGYIQLASQMLEEIIKFLEDNRSINKVDLVELYTFLATIYEIQDNSTEALKLFKLVDTIVESDEYKAKFIDFADDKNLYLAYKHLQGRLLEAVSHKNVSRFQEANILFQKVEKEAKDMLLKVDSSKRNPIIIILRNCYHSWGNLHKRVNPKVAMKYFELAEDYNSQYDSKNLQYSESNASLFLDKGQLYRVMKDLNSALTCYNQANEILINAKKHDIEIDIFIEVSLYNSIGNIYRDKEEYESAILWYDKAIDLTDKGISEGKYMDLSIYIQNINNRRGIYYKSKQKDKADVDTEKVLSLFNQVNWSKLYQRQVGIIGRIDNENNTTTLIQSQRDITLRADVLWNAASNYRNERMVRIMISLGNYEAALNLLELDFYEEIPSFNMLQDFSICYDNLHMYCHILDIQLLYISLSRHNYLGIKLMEGSIPLSDINKMRADLVIGRSLIFLIPEFFVKLDYISLAIIFYEIGYFYWQHLIMTDKAILGDASEMKISTGSKDEQRTGIKGLIETLLNAKKKDLSKSQFYLTLAQQFYEGKATEDLRKNYIDEWNIIKYDFTKNRILEWIPDIYIALELSLRAAQYGALEGKRLAAKIYRDKNFDRYDIDIANFIDSI